MFKRTAKVPIIAISEAKFDSATKKLAFKNCADNHTASNYQNSSEDIDIQSILSMVASEYDVSDSPNDYIFEAVRAVTAEVPNENGDAFPRDELLRFDHRLGKPVYATFIGKPHHINHRADNPKASRGVVLDASYNDLTPPSEDCPSCGHHTASVEGRDKCGVHCAKCGTTVKDEFVELLLAVDTRKDPTFAEGVRVGSLDSLSMGCEAGYTDCSICDNRARTVSQFCTHIKSGNKKKMFKAAGGERMSFEKCGDVVFTEISRVDQPADPTAKQREVFKIENMPFSVESEMLVMASKIAKLEGLVRTAQTGPTQSGADVDLVADVIPRVPFKNVAESIRWAESSIHKLKAEVHTLTADKSRKHKEASDEGRPFYAWENASYDMQIKANRQYVSRLEDYVAKAREMQASGVPSDKIMTRQMSRFFASKEAQAGGPGGQALEDARDELQSLGDMHPELGRALDELLKPGGPTDPNGLSEDSSVPDPMSIEDYTKKHNDEFDQKVSPAELGILPEEDGAPLMITSKILVDRMASNLDALIDSVKENDVSTNMKAYKFADSYKNLEATVTDSGNVKVHAGKDTLFVVRPETKPADKAASEKIASEILTSIAENGIVPTVLKYKTVIGPRMGQVLQEAIVDFDGGREEGDKDPSHEGGEWDLADERGAPPKSMVEEESTDRKDMVREKRNQENADVLEEHQPDHNKALPKGLKPSTEDPGSDMAPGRSKPSKDTLKDVQLDFKRKGGNKKAQMGAPAPAPAPQAPAGGNTMPQAPAGVSPMGAAEVCAELACSASPEECQCGPGCKCAPPCECACGAHMAQAPAGPMALAASTKKYVSRLERLYKTRLEKASADAANKVASAEQTVAARLATKFRRALKLAAKRQALNLEYSPLKAIMADVLINSSELDEDSFYPGMDAGTATHLIEAASESGFDQLVDSLVRRATELMAMNDETLVSLENDIKNIVPASVPVNVHAKRANAAPSQAKRQAAVDGNLLMAPSASETISNVDGRDNIRSALDSTKLRRTAQALLKR